MAQSSIINGGNIPLPSLITEGPEGCSFFELRLLRCLRFSRSKFYFSLMGHNTIHQQQSEDKLKALVTSTFRCSCVFHFFSVHKTGGILERVRSTPIGLVGSCQRGKTCTMVLSNMFRSFHVLGKVFVCENGTRF